MLYSGGAGDEGHRGYTGGGRWVYTRVLALHGGGEAGDEAEVIRRHEGGPRRMT